MWMDRARELPVGDSFRARKLSFNNLVDLDACWELVSEFAGHDDAAVAIIKHTNPCGAATGKTVLEAYKRALEADPCVGVWRRDWDQPRGGCRGCGGDCQAVRGGDCCAFVLRLGRWSGLRRRRNLRVIAITPVHTARVIKQVSGGLLVQDADLKRVTEAEVKAVTSRVPTPEEMKALLFGWSICKFVKSNAIVYARFDGGYGRTVGIGAGQMSRVDAARFGAMKAVLPLAGTVAASDAFFPFADGLEMIAQAGATAVIQPGGLGEGRRGDRGGEPAWAGDGLHRSTSLPSWVMG